MLLYGPYRIDLISNPILARVLDRMRCNNMTGTTAPRSGISIALLVVLFVSHGWDPALAQPPGTLPPQDAVVTPPEGAEADQLPVDAFLFLDESLNPVMMHRMPFEEIERLRNIEAGIDAPAQLYAFESLEITGDAQEGRCELDVSLRLSVDSTDGRWIAIPLRMDNFHRLGPPDITGLDEHRMTVATDGRGYVLWARTEQAESVLLTMRVAARVSSAPTRSVDFLLPDIPSTVRLAVNQANVSGEVVGRGDEVVQSEPILGGRTRLVVESGGGAFTLKWGTADRGSEASPVVEVESAIAIDWDSPTDLPLASVQMTVRNLRESLSSFDIRLPPNSVLLDAPTLGSTTTQVEVSAPLSEPEGDRIRVTVSDQERLQRIDLSLDLQLSSTETSASSPLQLQVPQVLGALRQRGEIQVRTASDYRLRWRSRPWVQTMITAPTEGAEANRSYTFRYDRATFSLPLWLSAKQRQLRLTSDTEVSLLDGLMSLEMTIEATGQSADGRGLQLDLADWQLRSITDLETGEQLDSYAADQYSEIEMSPRASDDPSPVRIRAERQLSDSDEIAFALPKIVKTDDNLLVQSALLQIRSDGRRSLVIDLDESTGLDPINESNDSDLVEPTLSRFRILPPDATARVVGLLVDQPPRITLATETSVTLEGDQIATQVDWTVSSLLSLEGRLPIRIAGQTPADSAATGADHAPGTPASTDTTPPVPAPASGAASGWDSWRVTVDGTAATLEKTGDDQFEIVSDRLLDGTMSIRLRHVQRVERKKMAISTPLVPLPRPAIADVSILGAMRIRLQGDAAAELVATDATLNQADPRSGGHELELESLPREPLRLSIRPRTPTDAGGELTIRRAVLRSAVGRSTRHEQLIATVDGGDSLAVELPVDASEVSLEAFVDGQPARVDRDQQILRVSVPPTGASHVVELRIWLSETTPMSVATIRPLMRLPAAVERLYWQVIAPPDSHALWASPMAGRAMRWRFGPWRLYRDSTHSDRSLNDWAGSDHAPRLPTESNRYLYAGPDVNSFEVLLVSRSVLWLVTGSIVLAVSSLLIYVPATRSPFTAVVAAIFLTGLLVIAPDAAVLLGQLGMIASVLVIIMFAIRSLITPRPSVRVLASTRSPGRREPSTRTYVRDDRQANTELTETQALPVQPTATEVSS